MQVVIAIPNLMAQPSFFELLGVLEVPGKAAESLLRPVCGVPLFTRVLATAARAGADRVLLVWPLSVPEDVRDQILRSDLIGGLQIVTVVSEEIFEPTNNANWEKMRPQLPAEFLWLPWNWVTTKQCLSSLEGVPISRADWSKPVLIGSPKKIVGGRSQPLSGCGPEGIAVISSETALQAERFLVARSGKVLDGIHTGFNRYLCRPAVRWLSHTRITPNEVSVAGLFVAIVSCWVFAQGAYWWCVLGALLCFVSGLFDEMDGMIARIKFADSPFGTWLEGYIDGVSYVLLFAGMALGLHKQNHGPELLVGVALLIGTVLTLVVTSLQRARAAPADHPNAYLGNFYKLLEKDSSNWVSRVVRHIQAFMRRGVMIHYVVIFTVLHGVSVFFYVSAASSHLTWMLALYFNRRFFRNPDHSLPLPDTRKGLEAQ